MEKEKITGLSAFIVFFGLALTILVSYLVIYPAFKNLKSKSLELANLKAELKAKEEKAANLETLSQKIGSLENRAAALEYALPREKEHPEVLYVLAAIAAKNKVYIADFAPDNKLSSRKNKKTTATQSVSSGIKKQEIELEILGEFNKIKNFLTDLENSRKIYQIEQLKLKVSKLESPAVLDGTISLVTYYQVD